jgi:hypothetical protein
VIRQYIILGLYDRGCYSPRSGHAVKEREKRRLRYQHPHQGHILSGLTSSHCTPLPGVATKPSIHVLLGGFRIQTIAVWNFRKGKKKMKGMKKGREGRGEKRKCILKGYK